MGDCRLAAVQSVAYISIFCRTGNTYVKRCIVKASVGDFGGAVNDLEYYISEQDITDKTANAHLLVSKIMLGDAEGALGELKAFVERQHQFYQNRRFAYFDFEEMDLRFSTTADANSKALDNRTGRITAVVSESYLSRLTSALLRGRQKGYLDLIPSVYFTVGSLFSEMNL